MTFDPLSRFALQRSSRLDKRARLRPMSSAEILDTSLGVYRNLGWMLLKASAVPSLICLAALVFVFEHVLPSLTTTGASGITGELLEALLAVATAVCVGGPLIFLGISYAGAVISHLVGDFMVGSVPNVEAASRAARRNLFRVAALSFREAVLSVTGLTLGALLLMVSAYMSDQKIALDLTPAVAVMALISFGIGLGVFPIVLILHAIAIPACVHESLPVGRAIKRGRQLLKGKPPFMPSGYDTVWALVCLLLLLLALVLGGISLAIYTTGAMDWLQALDPNLPFRPVVVGSAKYLPTFLTVWTIIPVWCTTTTILYFERRIRLEGYDIESLAKDIWRADRHSRFEL